MMKKKLVLSMLVTVAAATTGFSALFNTDVGDKDWFTATNYDPVGVPTAATPVEILNPNGAAAARIDSPGAVAKNVNLAKWGHPGHLVVGTNGTLETTAHILMGQEVGVASSITNNGAITAGSPLYCRGIDTFVNNGTLTNGGMVLGDGASAVTIFSNTGDVTVNGWLHISNGSTTPVAFNMNGGTVYADFFNHNPAGHAHINLHGGIITLGGMNLDGNGGYTIDISGGGELIVNGDHSEGMNWMASIGLITASDGGTPVAVFDGAKTTLKSTLEATPFPELAAKVYGPELIPNSEFENLANKAGSNVHGLWYEASSFGDLTEISAGAEADLVDWSFYYADPFNITPLVGTPNVEDFDTATYPLDNTFLLDTWLSEEEVIMTSAQSYRNGMKSEDILNGAAIDSGATYQFEVSGRTEADNANATFTAALTTGTDATNTANAVSGSLIEVPIADLGAPLTVQLSGSDLIAGQVNVMFYLENTDPIPGVAEGSNVLIRANYRNGDVFSKVGIDSVSLLEVSDPQANDLNRDGLENIQDADFSQSYLDGSIDGGDDAVTRQSMNIASGMTTNEALAALNLTEFDYDGNGFFDAADVAALEANFPLLIESGVMNGSGHFTVEVSGLRVGTEYHLKKDADLVSGSFAEVVDSVTAASETETLSDTNSAVGSAFYKVTD